MFDSRETLGLPVAILILDLIKYIHLILYE